MKEARYERKLFKHEDAKSKNVLGLNTVRQSTEKLPKTVEYITMVQNFSNILDFVVIN